MVAESWFRGLWKNSKRSELLGGNARIEVLAFEAASLMSKLLHLWQLLSDKQVARLREEIAKSEGIKKIVSEDDDYIGRLICAELTDSLVNVAVAVGRLSKRCHDPLVKSFEQAFSDLVKVDADIYGWQFSWREMDKKAKKMENYIVANTNLYQDMEILAELEQTLNRMKGNDNADSITLVEYEKKIAWKRKEVKHLKEISLWNRTYDYTILLLARSLFTIYGKIGHVFGTNRVADAGIKESRVTGILSNRRNHSTVFMQSSVYPSENCDPRLSASSAGKPSISMSGPLPRTKDPGNYHSGPLASSRIKDPGNYHSGPLASSRTTSSSMSRKYNGVSFYSGPIKSSTAKSGPVSEAGKNTMKFWWFRDKSRGMKSKTPSDKSNGITAPGPLSERSAPMSNIYSKSVDGYSGMLDGINDAFTKPHAGETSIETSKRKMLNAPPETLGAAALALHYANVIIFIEKLVASPHLIGNDARDDLYNMLPNSIRTTLWTKLKPCAKILSSSVYDTALAAEWNEAMMGTLEWLAPLAHNMIRWQSERTLEHQNMVSKTNVLLVQTLHFANQEKTEAAIAELLVGLNYIWRFGREINANAAVECASGRTFDEYMD